MVGWQHNVTKRLDLSTNANLYTDKSFRCLCLRVWVHAVNWADWKVTCECDELSTQNTRLRLHTHPYKTDKSVPIKIIVSKLFQTKQININTLTVSITLRIGENIFFKSLYNCAIALECIYYLCNGNNWNENCQSINKTMKGEIARKKIKINPPKHCAAVNT